MTNIQDIYIYIHICIYIHCDEEVSFEGDWVHNGNIRGVFVVILN